MQPPRRPPWQAQQMAAEAREWVLSAASPSWLSAVRRRY